MYSIFKPRVINECTESWMKSSCLHLQSLRKRVFEYYVLILVQQQTIIAMAYNLIIMSQILKNLGKVSYTFVPIVYKWGEALIVTFILPCKFMQEL